ncbi:Bx42 [Symbiodinium microadriaticum]|nr:Bx42 [Symbiodinium microadriaticum]
MQLPSTEEEEETADATRRALESLLDGKIKKAKPSSIASTPVDEEEPKYIRYTPNPNAPGYNAAAKQRVIRMVEAQVDPMEPPKHKIKKVPRGGGSPPVPVLHSPPRSLTVKDQQMWKIPPCVSNWKNARGYTIPLDKRLAADGRGLQEVTINNKFASFSESLYIAERKAAEDLRVRNQIRKKMAMREKEDREKELRELASKARMERAGVLGGGDEERQPDDEPPSYYQRTRPDSDREDEDAGESIDGAVGSRRTTIEEEEGGEETTSVEMSAEIVTGEGEGGRRKEREREIRLENMKGTMRKNKIDRDMNRDVSEKIALGMHRGSGQLSGEAMYDARLFNQSGGMDSGFGGEDEYNTYSKPLFDRAEAASVYRPKRDDSEMYGDVDSQMAKLSDTSKFKPDKGFKGAEGSHAEGGRSAPVQFERPKDEDPFGIDDIVDGSSSRKKARRE